MAMVGLDSGDKQFSNQGEVSTVNQDHTNEMIFLIQSNQTTSSGMNMSNVSGTVDPQVTTVESEQDRVLIVIVLLLGILGSLANGFVLHVLGRSDKFQKKSAPILVLNQLALDLFSSLFLVVTYIWKLVNPRLTGTLHIIFCLLIGSEGILWSGLNCSILNMTFMTIERYIKIVFPIFYRDHHHKWMTFFLAFLAWFVGFLMNYPELYTTTDFSNGNCLTYTQFPTDEYRVSMGVYFVLLEYLIPILTFLICYGHIIVVVRRSGKLISADDNDFNTTIKVKNNKSEKSIIKVMVTTSCVFAICWTPLNVYYSLVVVYNGCCGYSMTDIPWYVSMFLGFITIIIQPFIYVYGLKPEAMKNDIIKRLCRKEAHANRDSYAMSCISEHVNMATDG